MLKRGLRGAAKLNPLGTAITAVRVIKKAPDRWRKGRRGRRGFAGFFNRIHHTVGREVLGLATGGLVQ